MSTPFSPVPRKVLNPSPSRQRVSRRGVLGGVGIAAAAGVAAPGLLTGGQPAHAESPEVVETDLGPAVSGLSFNNGILLDRTIWLGSARMDPARVAGFDLDEGVVTSSIELPGVKGIWGIDVLGTDLYVGTFTPGKLIRIDTISGAVVDEINLREEVAWNVSVAPDGQVFTGTYPSAELWQYDPESGEATNHGRMSSETYIRDLAATETTVYCGIGAQPSLIAFDRATGESSDIMPTEWADIGLTFVAVLELSGDHLLAGTTPFAHVAMINTRDHSDYTVVEIPNDEPYVVSLYGSGEDVYVGTTQSNTIWHTTIGSTEVEPLSVGTSGTQRLGHLDENTLWTVQNRGASTLDLATGEMTELDLVSDLLQPAPQQPQTLGWADGRVFVPGSGVMSVHDDASGDEPATFRVQGEIKDFFADDSTLYTGHYTQARFGRMPTDGDEIELLTKLPPEYGQTRPRDLAMDSEHGRVLMGTEPDYGGWEGSLAWMDLATQEVEVFRSVLTDQSVVAVCPGRDGAFIGGSVINGFGTTPTRDHAQLGFFSYETASVTRIADPFPKTRDVVNLRVHGSLLLAMTYEGLLVGMDPETFDIHWELQVAIKGGRTTRIGSTLYGTDAQTMWAVDLQGTEKPSVRTVVDGLEGEWWSRTGVSSDGLSALFTMRGFHLVRFDLPPLTLPEIQAQAAAAVEDGTLRNPLASQITNTLDQAARHRDAGRDQQADKALDRAGETLRSGKHPSAIDTELREALVHHLERLG